MDQLSVAQVGPWPPPYGGVSVHIQRVHRRLRALRIRSRVYAQPALPAGRDDGVVPTPLRLSWKSWVPRHALGCDAGIVHFHDGWYWMPAARVMLWRGRRVVMTFHDQQAGTRKWENASGFERRVSRASARDPRIWWIAVSPAVERQLVEKGVPADRIAVIPAYIPPAGEDGPELPAGLRSFLAAHRPVLSTYGWKLTRDARGTDLYGFDLCIEAVRALRPEHPDLGLVVSLPQVADEPYFAELQARIAAAGLGGHVRFEREPLDGIHRLWRASDVHVRATNTDGDAVAVREALHLGVPVVASDAAHRPEGTVLFRSRDQAAFETALRRVLADPAGHAAAARRAVIPDNFVPLLELYRRIAATA